MTPRHRTPLLVPSLLALLAIAPSARADEGQWPPEALATLGDARWKELAGRGLERSATELWDGQGGGLLTAVIDVATPRPAQDPKPSRGPGPVP